MAKPTFIGIGAQKCASTWLHRILSEHPQIGMPQEKEVDFFSYHFDHGYQWYERQFDAYADRKARGEVSPSYFSEPGVPGRIRHHNPEVKIIVSLRDPVARALSNHRHEIRVGHFKGRDLSFDAGLANNPMYIDQSCYATHLTRWMRHFPSSSMLFIFMEDIVSEPGSVARSVFDFLGVDADYCPRGLSSRYNRSFANRYQGLARVKDGFYRYADRPGLRWLWGAGVVFGLRAVYRSVNVLPSERVIPRPDDHTLAQLRARFAPEVRELSRLIGRPLDHWLET